VLSTLLLCTVAVPTYLLAREHVGPRVAAVPAAMTVAGTWMITGAGLLTENLAFPLSTASLAATVMTLRRPSSRWRWAAVALALLAAWSRMQMLVLLPVLVCALLLDVLRSGDERAARWRAHRSLVIPAALVLLVVIVAPDATIGSYGGIVDARPSLRSLLESAGVHWIDLVTMAAFVPAAALGVAFSRRAWRDDDLGPLLCVALPAVVLLALQAAFAVTGWDVQWSIQRYVMYAVPLLFVLATVVAPRAAGYRWPLLAGAAIVVASVAAAPELRSALEERAVYATDTRVGAVLGGSTAVSLAALAILSCAAVAAWWLAPVRRRVGSALPVMAGVVFAVLALQSEAVWQWQISLTNQLRDSAPAPLRWLDQNATADVAHVGLTQSGRFFGQVEFFNRRVVRDYAPPGGYQGRVPPGHVCDWTIGDRGTVAFERACGTPPTQLWFDDPFARVTLHSQRVLAQDRMLGRIVDAGSRPRVLSILTLPCADATKILSEDKRKLTVDRSPCAGKLRALLWLDEAATLEVRFRGSELGHAVQADPGRVVEIPAGKVTTVRWKLPSGPASLDVPLDWSNLDGPEMVGADLVAPDGRRTSLTY